MKAILISAGQGTRLLPLTIHLPKCLVEINGRAILDHQIDALHEAGIEEVIVVCGYRNEQIREHLQKYRAPVTTRLLINPFWSVGSSIGSVWAARDYLDDPFCLINGDTVFDATVIKDAWQRAQPGVNLVVEPMQESSQDDMRVQVRDGRVAAVGKKLPVTEATHRSLGIVLNPYLPGGDYRRALQAVIEEPDGHNAYHHAVIDRLARSVGVAAIENRSGLWCEVDRPEDIERWDPRPPTQTLAADPAVRGPVAFFFLGETLLIPHLYPVVEELARQEDLVIDLWVITSVHEELLRKWSTDLGPARIRIRRAPWFRNLPDYQDGRNPPLADKALVLMGMLPFVLRTPVAVVAEQTSLWMPTLLPCLRRRFIKLAHGSGTLMARDDIRRRSAWRMPVPSESEQRQYVQLGFDAGYVPVVGFSEAQFPPTHASRTALPGAAPRGAVQPALAATPLVVVELGPRDRAAAGRTESLQRDPRPAPASG